MKTAIPRQLFRCRDQLAKLLLWNALKLAPQQLDRPGHSRVGGQEPVQRHRTRTLARPRLANDGEHLAALDLVVEADGGRVESTVDPEVDPEVRDFENCFRRECCRGHQLTFPAVSVERSAKLVT